MRFAVCLLVFVSAACSTTAQDTNLRHAAAPLRECGIDGIRGPVRCGTVRVAEDPAAPAGRQIDLRVIVAAAYSSTPERDPIVPLAGGPGQGAADLAVILAQRFDWLRDTRDLVLIDQRGSGASNGLHCTPPATARELMGKLFDPVRLRECRDRLSQRADLTKYSTPFAAGDYERVFDALGYEQVNIIGLSYGTRLGLELARRMPVRVRTLTIEGVVPPAPFEWPTMAAADSDAALQALIADCKGDSSCRSSYPRFQQDVDVAFRRLDRESISVNVRDPMTGMGERVLFGKTDMAYAVRGLLYGNEALSLPKWFSAAAQGSFDVFAQSYVNRARTLGDQIATGVHLGVYCAEDLPFVDWPRAEKLAAGTRIAGYLLDQYRRACEVWPSAPLPASSREPVQSSVPSLIMSGRRDPATPPRTAHEAARTLPRAHVVVWPKGAHGADGLVSRDCRTSIERAFIHSARSDQLPTGCVNRDATLPFAR